MSRVATPWAPDRGDLVWISMAPTTGHEQSGRRPALVLSPLTPEQAAYMSSWQHGT